MPTILLVGFNHRTAAVDLREQFALNGCGLRMALSDLVAVNGISPHLYELAIISTCNRMEFVAVVEDLAAGQAALESYLVQNHHISPAALRSLLYVYSEREAVTHLFRVASGLDSLILGEPQILGQIANAHSEAHLAGASGPLLSHLFNQALHCGKRAHTETTIGSHTTSISHAAADTASQWLGGLTQRRALVIGAGEMAELAAVALQQHGATDINCINRTLARAERLAQQVDGNALDWPSLVPALVRADVVVSATSAPHPVLCYGDVAAAVAQRAGRPLLLLDIAMPRDIENTVDTLIGVQRLDLDHLRDAVDANLAKRAAAVPVVESIIEEEVDAFSDWRSGRQVAPTLVQLRRKAELVAGAEVERTLRRLTNGANHGELNAGERHDTADERIEHELAQMAHRIVNKLLHEPTVRLKAQAASGNGVTYANVVQDLFALEPMTPSRNGKHRG
ncbi:MAG: glutamyl-tRNA reductase [Anaerolineales bacterium]|nr:glutamyl-tRNA reductase [Anaerolineales bacterium]